MFALLPIIPATVLVTLGYFVMWTASQEKTPKGIMLFGKVMSIILFVIAGLIIIAGMTFAPIMMRKMACCMNMPCMSEGMGKMHGMMGMKEGMTGREKGTSEYTKEMGKEEKVKK